MQLPLRMFHDRPESAAQLLWFRVEIGGPDDRSGPTGVYLHNASPKARYYINGVDIGASEDFDSPYGDNWNHPIELVLPGTQLHAGKNELLFAIRGMYGRYTSLSRITVGPEQQIRRRYQRHLWLQVIGIEIVSLFVFLIGLFAVSLWWRRRDDPIFGLFALSCGLWILRNSQFYVTDPIMTQYGFMMLADGALFWLVAVLFMLSFRILERPRLLFERIIVGYATLVTGVMLLGGPRYEIEISNIAYVGLMPTSIAFFIYVSLLVFRRGTALQWLLWLAALVTSGTAGYDLASSLGWVRSIGAYVMPYSSLFYAATVGFALVESFVTTHLQFQRLNAELGARVLEREEQLSQYYSRVSQLERESAVASERERIVRDMHDGLGLQLISSARLLEKEDLTRAQVAELFTEALDELRISIDSVKPTARDLLEMLGNLRYRLEPRLKVAGITLQWDIGDIEGLDSLPPTTVSELTRIVQEATTNTMKHANASQLHLQIRALGSDRVSLCIADNGRGFDSEHPVAGVGLNSMRHRAQRIGAELTIDSLPGRTAITVIVNLEHPAAPIHGAAHDFSARPAECPPADRSSP